MKQIYKKLPFSFKHNKKYLLILKIDFLKVS